jgi:hypothetical protein
MVNGLENASNGRFKDRYAESKKFVGFEIEQGKVREFELHKRA